MTLSQAFSAGAVLLDLAIIMVLIPRILVQRRESAATLAWVMFILALPIFGALLYVAIGTQRLRRRRVRRAHARELLASSAATLRATLTAYNIDGVASRDHPHVALARSFCIDPQKATVGNEVAVFNDGEEAFKALCDAVSSARSYIHVEFYIFQDDDTGRHLLALLAERARAGVEVRLLVDAIGSWGLRPRTIEPFKQAGGLFAQFLPVALFTRPFHINLRNHRKIVVVDGRVAFTGGMNIGDEYRSRDPEIGHWRDTQARVRGPAALRLQEIFAEDWHFATGERCLDARYLVAPELPGSVVVDVVESGPDRTAEAIYKMLFVAITRAERRVWLTTPYFIPDRAILTALITAAERGVDVRLLLPGWCDHRFVLHAGRAHYDELLRAGVQIFEYGPGMLHAKTMVVDDHWSTIGSANMDRRSFHLNWEANLVMLDAGMAAAMARRFELDVVHAVPIPRHHRPSLHRRLVEAVCALLAPLL